MIELRNLRHAVAAAEEGHARRAAKKLHISQPPLSQQIKALETMVGAPLFLRHPRGVDLTDAGRIFVARARRILQDVDLAGEAARRAARGEEGRLALGFTTSAAFHPLVSAAVRALRETAPAIELSLEEASTGDLIEALRAGRLDAAFVRSPVERVGNLRIAHILDEDMLIAAPDSHRLARKVKRRVGLAALAAERFVLYRRPTGPGLYDAIIAACRAAGFSPDIAQEAPRLLSTLSLVAAGFGVSIVPASMARLEANGVAYIGIARAARLTAPLHLARRDETPSGALARFMAIVEARARCAGSPCRQSIVRLAMVRDAPCGRSSP